MKTVLFTHSLIMFVLTGCVLTQNKDEVKSFIPGIYIRHYSDEYTSSFDTITIKTVTTSGSEAYSITRRSRLEKQTNDGRFEPGYDVKNWTGVYDEKTKTLWLESAGKRMYFDPQKNELKIGTQPYKKLKI